MSSVADSTLSAKKELMDNGCTDEVLGANLDFAERVFEHSQLYNEVTLLVKGQWQSVQIGSDEDVTYIVSSEDGQPRIDCTVSCSDLISPEDVKKLHFSVHSCQDESKSCFKQAQAAVQSTLHELKITCNRFTITYMVMYSDLSIYEKKYLSIKTSCNFHLAQITAKGLLEKKCWLEKEKPKCSELKKCLDFLIKKYLTMPEAPTSNCKFILQGDKEMLEITSPHPDVKYLNEYILINESCSNVSMFPPDW